MPPQSGNALAAIAAFGAALASLGSSSAPIRVLDFGGFDGRYEALMSATFPDLSFSWTVVELPSVVTAFSTHVPSIDFSSDLDACLAGRPHIFFASASLNYIPDPDEVLSRALTTCSTAILTRVPLWPLVEHRVAVQRTQRKPEVSYPTWFFSEDRFLAELENLADVVLEFECPDDRAAFNGHYSTYRGLVARCRRPSIEPQA